MAVTHFVTQFTHVSKHFSVYSRKQKILLMENCFKNVILTCKKKLHMCSQKYVSFLKCKELNKLKIKK